LKDNTLNMNTTAKATTTFPGKVMSIGIMAGITAVYFYSYMQRVAIPGTIFDELQVAFHASASAITALSVVFFYIYGGMQFVAGAWIDRVGVLTVMLTGGAVLCVGSFMFPTAHSLPLLYTARVLVALGASLVYACVVKSLDVLFSTRMFPIVLGVTISIAYSGGLVGTLPFAVVSDKYGWRETLLAIAGLTLLAFIITVPMLIRTHILRQGSKKVQGLSSIGTVLRNRCSHPVILISAINFSVYFFFQATLGKKMLHDIYHLSSAAAATFPCIMMFVAIIGLLVSGILSRALGHKRKPVVLLSSGAMVIGGILLMCCVNYDWNYMWVMVSYCLLGFMSLGSVMTGTLMKELNPPETIGTAIGLSNGSCYIAMAIFTSIAGLIMDHFSSSTITVQGAVVYPKAAYLSIIGFGILLLVYTFYLTCILRETNGIPVGVRVQSR